jgi:hypothetical protein
MIGEPLGADVPIYSHRECHELTTRIIIVVKQRARAGGQAGGKNGSGA